MSEIACFANWLFFLLLRGLNFPRSVCKISAMADVVRTYRLLPDALAAEEKRIRSSYVPSLVLVLAISTVVGVFLGTSKGATPKSTIEFCLFMAACLAYVVFWSPRRMKRRLAQCWKTYELEIGEDYLLRRQADVPDLRLKFHDVQAVEHVPGRYLRVVGRPKSQVVSIPEGIEHFEQVREAVSSIHAVQVQSVEQWKKHRAFMAAGLILYATMLWSTSPIVVIPLSLLMGATIVWLFLWMRRNPNLLRSTKRMAWLYLAFVLMCALKLFVAVASYLPQQSTR